MKYLTKEEWKEYLVELRKMSPEDAFEFLVDRYSGALKNEGYDLEDVDDAAIANVHEALFRLRGLDK